MRILLKYTLKSIGERKFRAFLIIFAIALSGGLFLASTRLSDNIGVMFLKQIKQDYGNIDLVIYPGAHAKTSFVNTSVCDKVMDEIDSTVMYTSTSGTFEGKGTAKSCNIVISGYNLEEYKKINEIKVVQGDLANFKGNGIILSQKGAEALGVSVGDSFDLKIAGAKRRVKLVAIAAPKGMFSTEREGFVAMMPFDLIAQYNKTNGKPSMIYIKVKPGVVIKELQVKIQAIDSRYEVQELIDPQMLADELSQITVPFLLMTSIVVFMSIFIIYSCFKVIMLEKLPIVGTFRSIGADKKMMNRVLLLEALFYGITGGLAACLLGIGCLYGLEWFMATAMLGSTEGLSLEIPMSSFIAAFMSGVIMAVLSTIIPILGVSKISLKDIILNNRPYKKSKRVQKCIVGTIIILTGFAMAIFIKGSMATVTSLLGFLLVIIGVIKILPVFVLNVSKVLGIVFRIVFGNIGELATKNIKKNKSVLNSITLITIGMSILLTISTMTKNMEKTVFDAYGDIHCEVMGMVGNFKEPRVKMLRRTEGVSNVIECIQDQRKVKEFDNHKIVIEGLNTLQMTPDLDFHIQGDERELLSRIQNGRYMILNHSVMKRYKKKVGDQINLDFDGKPRTYTIIGEMNTRWNNGQMALVSNKYYRQDAKVQEYSWFYMKLRPGTDPYKVIENIQTRLKDEWSYINTVHDMAIENVQQNAQVMSLISVFAILAMIIGVVGILNNLMISFIERKQNIAMLRSIGMSKLQVLKMIFIEGLGSGLVGALGGIFGGFLGCKIFEYILLTMDLEMKMRMIPQLFISYLIGGMLITVIGSIIPARGSSKLNIIEAIKYE